MGIFKKRKCMYKKLSLSVATLLTALLPLSTKASAAVNPSNAVISQPMVSITLDDTWRNQYTAGAPILDKYDIKATFYALTETWDYPDYMDSSMLLALKASGHEIASHTVSHPDLTTLTVAQMDAELANSKTALQALLDASSAKNFATPYGSYNATVLTEIKKYYRSHRSVEEGFNTTANFDIYNIQVQNILDNTTPAQVAAWVAEAQAQNAWLVLTYHGVEADPSSTEENYSVTPANFDTELAQIKASGISIKTVDEALDIITGVTQPAKPGDVNGDNAIDALDLSIILSNWNKTGQTKAQGDLNSDGTVDALDLSTVLTNWSK